MSKKKNISDYIKTPVNSIKYVKTISEQMRTYQEIWKTKDVYVRIGTTGSGSTPNYQF